MKECLALLCCLAATALSACASLSDRPITEVDRSKIVCLQPPPDVRPAGFEAKLDATVKEVGEIAKLNVSAQQKAERLREAAPWLQSFEVAEYRFCTMWAQGAITKEQYVELVDKVIPKILTADDGKKSVTPVNDDKKSPAPAKVFTSLIPKLLTPQNGEEFSKVPRTVDLTWQPVTEAVRYIVEVQGYDPSTGTWFPEPNHGRSSVQQPKKTIDFIGAQPGRWRVWAVNSAGEVSQQSPWWEFNFKN